MKNWRTYRILVRWQPWEQSRAREPSPPASGCLLKVTSSEHGLVSSLSVMMHRKVLRRMGLYECFKVKVILREKRNAPDRLSAAPGAFSCGFATSTVNMMAFGAIVNICEVFVISNSSDQEWLKTEKKRNFGRESIWKIARANFPRRMKIFRWFRAHLVSEAVRVHSVHRGLSILSSGGPLARRFAMATIDLLVVGTDNLQADVADKNDQRN